MSLFSGITADSAKHLQLDAGAFVKNYDPTTDTFATAKAKIIGATAGGGSFSAVPTIRKIEVDGAKGDVKGFKTIDEWVVTLTANVKEITADTIAMALANGKSAVATAPANYKKITAGGEIANSDYIGNVGWVGRLSGSNDPIIIIVKNVLNTSGLSLTMADKGEGLIALTLTGHYTPDDLETAPFEIYYPNVT